ncbi:MAG: hypothetical protein HUJ95_01945, partial [Bacteroidales bacterium]|nr:hypothetical protein [Bacteroidales bacterium]
MDERTAELFAYKTEYEYSVIGALCIDPSMLDSLMGVVSAEDFMLPMCRKIYEAALAKRNNGEVFDALIAADTISQDVPDSQNFIANCMNLTPSVNNAVQHAEIIRKSAKDRLLRETIRTVLDEKSGDECAVEIAAACQKYLSGRLGKTRSLADVMQTLF